MKLKEQKKFGILWLSIGAALFLAGLLLGETEGVRRQYARRAFSWRGIGPLRRNLALKEETAPAEEEDRPSS